MEIPEGKRPKCKACGGLTRFEAITVTRTEAYHHFTTGGELNVEDVKVLSKTVEGFICIYCGHGNDIEWIDLPGVRQSNS